MMAIKNFDGQAAVNFISNTLNNNNHDSSTFNALNLNPTFNPIDKVIELYVRISKDKDTMIAELRKK